ncbi:MAG: hypothetical protein ACOVOI_01390, partial [Hyphomicrobiales bacterium]
MKAEGGAMIDGRRQSLTISVGAIDENGARVKLAVLPADHPVAIDVDGLVKTDEKGPRFEGTATVARAEPVGRGDKATDEE